jgi:multicomponent Na+:H+ antiporter subunit D
MLLLGIATLYAKMGTVNMAHLSEKIAAQGGLAGGAAVAPDQASPLLIFATVLFICGLGLKGALVPFHAWLPDAHPSAPAPISAMLSGVLIKAVGVYALTRVLFSVIGVTQGSVVSSVIMVLGVLSMVLGGLVAIGQEDLKRLLAYSSISQIGYVMLGIGLATPLGVAAGLFHLLNHAIFKSLLFLNAGAIEYRTGTRQLKEMGGLNRRMPVTGATSFIGSMSISGVPPFNGFFSKLLIIIACFQAGRWGFATVAVLVSVVTLAYFLKVQKEAFFGPLKQKWQSIREVPAMMVASMVLLAVLCLVTSLLWLEAPRKRLLGEAQKSLSERREYVKRVLQLETKKAAATQPEED